MDRAPLTAGSRSREGSESDSRSEPGLQSDFKSNSKSNSKLNSKSASESASSISGYDLDLDRAVQLIRKSSARRVGLQAPEGLKRAAPGIASRIEKETGSEVIISGDPCYGACDVDLSLCGEVDLMLHLGHAGLGEEQEKVVFLEARMKEDLYRAAENALGQLRSRRVGVATTVQHIHKLDQALEVLNEHGIEGLLGPASGRIKYPGQVLGCSYASARALNTQKGGCADSDAGADVDADAGADSDADSNAEIDEYLFIGTGRFHPLGIALATGKRVLAADPITGEVSEIDPDPMLRHRFAAITKASEAKRIAILVSKKPGQRRMALAKRLRALGESRGREMFLVYLDNIEPDCLLNLGAEAAVSTACPRVALDDAAKYRIPLLTPPEFEIMVGEREWEDYLFDEIVEND